MSLSIKLRDKWTLTVNIEQEFPQQRQLIRSLNKLGVYSMAKGTWTVEVELFNRVDELAREFKIGLRVGTEVYNRFQAIRMETERWKAIGEKKLKKFPMKPFPHQVLDVGRMMSEKKSVINANPIGLGKTYEAIGSLEHNDAVLVITRSVLKGMWHHHVSTLSPEFKCTVLKKKDEFRWPTPGEVLVANYDIMKPLPAPPPQITLVFDEAQALKSSSSLRNKLANEMLHGSLKKEGIYLRNGKAIFLSATPLENSPEELFQLLHLAGKVKETFGSWDSYCREFDSVLKDHKRIWRDPSPRALALLSRVIIRHDKKILNLPPRIYQDIDLELTKDAAAICKHLEDTLKRLNVDLEQALDSLDSMGDKDKDSIITAFKHLASLKIPSMLGVLESYEDSKTPVIVASVHRAPIEILKDRPGWKVIYGDMSESEREASWRAFQAGEVVGLGVTIQTAGEGLTLTQGAHMIFVDRHWNPQKNLQCEGRIYRIGQSKTSNYIDLRWDHPLESRKYEILNKKKALIERTIDSIPSISTPKVESKATWEEWCIREAEKIDSPDIKAAVEYYRTWGRLKREWWNLVEFRVMNMHKDASLELPNG